MQDVNGNTALYFAVLEKQPDAVQALLERGANPKTKNSANKSPFDCAKSNGESRIIMLLEDNIRTLDGARNRT